MAITKAFRDAVASGNITGVRIMMKDSLLVDPTFREFDEMARLAGNMGSGLYEKHDGQELSDDTSQWTTGYMDRLMVELVDNFSHERIEHLKRVVRHIYPVSEPTAAPKPSQNTGTRTSPNSGTHSHTKSGETVYSPKDYKAEKERDVRDNKPIKVVKSSLKGAVLGGFCGGAAFHAFTTAAESGTEAAIGGTATDAVLIGALVGAVGMGVAALLSDDGGR